MIGNAKYEYAPKLTNPADDARLIAQTLRGLGFDIIGGGAQIDLDKGGMEKAIRAFGRRLGDRTVGVFYYSGHGLQIQGTNYLVPVSGNPASVSDIDFELLNVNVVLRQMGNSSSGLNLLILDASRNNPFSGPTFRDAVGGLAPMQAPRGTLIAYATQPGSIATDGDGANSPFTKALAAAMVKPDLDMLSVFNDIGVTVDLATKHTQQPWTSSTPIEGKFYFTAVREKEPAPPDRVSPDTTQRQVAPPAKTPEQVEIAYWDTIKDSRNPADFDAYLKRFPNGAFRELAGNRLATLNQQKVAVTPPPAPPPVTVKPEKPKPTGDMVTTRATFMRGSPNDAAKFVARLRQGEHVTVTGKAGDDWYAVTARGNLQGYVWITALKDPGDSNNARTGNENLPQPVREEKKPPARDEAKQAALTPPPLEARKPENSQDLVEMTKRLAEEAAARARAEADQAMTANDRGEAAAARARQEAQKARQGAPGHFAGNVETNGAKSTDRYEGEVSNNAWNGYGIYMYSDGARFEGEWKDGSRNGFGVNYWANGERSSGEERNDKRSGAGINVLPNGSTYKGQWGNDDRNGYGVLPWDDGRYEGEFHGGWADGYGVGTYTNGQRYEGQFVHGNWNGRGVLTAPDGSVEAGMFISGTFSGPFDTAQQ